MRRAPAVAVRRSPHKSIGILMRGGWATALFWVFFAIVRRGSSRVNRTEHPRLLRTGNFWKISCLSLQRPPREPGKRHRFPPVRMNSEPLGRGDFHAGQFPGDAHHQVVVAYSATAQVNLLCAGTILCNRPGDTARSKLGQRGLHVLGTVLSDAEPT